MAATILLVTGIPGTGKSTLSQKLAKDTGISSISKDDIKEFLYEKLGATDADAAKMLGKISFDVVYSIIENYLAYGKSVIIDCPFHAAFAKDKVAEMLSINTGGNIVELHCELPETVRSERFVSRMGTEKRHPVHQTGDISLPKSQAELDEIYAPLGLGPVMRVNTEIFGAAEYAKLLKELRATLGDKIDA